MDTLNVASINWEVAVGEPVGDPLAPIVDAVDAALGGGAKVVLLPECCVLELLRAEPGLQESETAARLSGSFDHWCASFSDLAKAYGAIVVAGTAFERTSAGVQNVCPVCLPDGRVLRTAKNRLTAYEKEVWRLAAGEGLFALQDPPIGVAICYDSEFPEATRALAEEGIQVLCIPAFTEGRRGFQRVRWCAHARSVENQQFVLHSSLVGGFGREPLPMAWGTSAVLCPSHEPFPDSAVLAETQPNRFGIASAELDFEMLAECRRGGDVRNWDDREPKTWRVDLLQTLEPES